MKRTVLSIIPLLFLIVLPYEGTSFENDRPGTTYATLPFNPADTTETGTVVTMMLGNRFRGGIGRNISVLAYKKSGGKLYLAQEIWGPATREYHEESTYELTLGKISVNTYVRDQFGINLPAGTPVTIVKEKFCDCDMSNDGTIKVYDFFGGADCIRVHFLVNGANVPFCGDSSLMVSANIFMHPTVPITGMRQARFFFLEKYEGKWVRTHPTEFTTLRDNGNKNKRSYTFDEYYRINNWTKLFKYMHSGGESAKPASLKTGDRVLAKYSSYYYPALIESISGDRASVKWFDGSKPDLKNIKTEIRSLSWSAGSDIVCKRPWDNKWADCGVRSISGENLSVLFSGTDVATRVHIGQCRDEGQGASPAPVPADDGAAKIERERLEKKHQEQLKRAEAERLEKEKKEKQRISEQQNKKPMPSPIGAPEWEPIPVPDKKPASFREGDSVNCLYRGTHQNGKIVRTIGARLLVNFENGKSDVVESSVCNSR